MFRWFPAATILLIATTLAGCGGGAKTASVAGTVTFDGSPLEEGTISFIPADGKGPTGGGAIKDGKYTATKVPVGNTKVAINGVKVVGKKKAYDTPDSPEMSITKEIIPERYNTKTELTFEVQNGENQKDWTLAK